MAGKSNIEWTEATLNPWTGCTKVSPGCARCYISRTMPFRTTGRDFDRKGKIPLVFHMERLEKMVRRRKPTMYFVNSLSDLFHEDAHDEQIAECFAAFARAPQHTFQVLTKRPERMKKLLGGAWIQNEVDARAGRTLFSELPLLNWPLPNVWLGVTIENRRFVDRASLLRETPAAVRFISAEPLLGPLVEQPRELASMAGVFDVFPWQDSYDGPGLDLANIDWLIVGGESGPDHRPMDPQWALDLRDACVQTGEPCAKCGGRAGRREFGYFGEPDEMLWCSECHLRGRVGGTSFFFKQWGGRTPKAGGRILDGRTWDEYPATSAREVEGALF